MIWTLGWSIIFGSIFGILMVPIWWIGLLCHISIEENQLIHRFGEDYLRYMKKARGRMIPGLPI
ncbi:hypothetical protein JW835_00550 [bacterium]|nr:hypothetical protein [bacterium]